MIVITQKGHKSPWPPPVAAFDSPNPVQSWLQKLVHSLHYGLRNNKTLWFYCNNEQWILVEKLCVPRAALGHLNHADHLSTSPTTSTLKMMNGSLMLQLPEVRERPRFDVADIKHTYGNIGEVPIQYQIKS